MIRNVCFSHIDVVVDSRVIPVSCSLIKTSCWRGFVAVMGFDLTQLGGFKGPVHPNQVISLGLRTAFRPQHPTAEHLLQIL